MTLGDPNPIFDILCRLSYLRSGWRYIETSNLVGIVDSNNSYSKKQSKEVFYEGVRLSHVNHFNFGEQFEHQVRGNVDHIHRRDLYSAAIGRAEEIV